MIAALERLVPAIIRKRGDEYYGMERVEGLTRTPDGVLLAVVQGEHAYRVSLLQRGPTLRVGCECRYFRDRIDVCKHIWATVRSASDRGLLSETVRWLEYEDPDQYDEEVELSHELERMLRQKAATALKPKRAPWLRLFDAIPKERSPSGSKRGGPLPEEIGYLLAGMQHASANTMPLSVVGRSHRKNGEWRKWQSFSLPLDRLQELTDFDRETLGLLSRSYIFTTETHYIVSGAMAAWWIERLARTGRLWIEGQDEPEPVGWDDGEPWHFRLAIERDEATKSYHIDGILERADETMPTAAIRATFNGVMIAGGRAVRMTGSENLPWLAAVRAQGPVEIPFSDRDTLRAALLDAPPVSTSLPPELRWEEAVIAPRPLLVVRHQGTDTDLLADVYFDYDSWRVHPKTETLREVVEGQVVRRDVARENTYRDRFLSMAIASSWGGYRIRSIEFEPVARTLIGEGWRVELDAAPVRTATAFDLEITSGIDWFDLSGGATFGEHRVSLPDLLQAASGLRSTMKLTDGSTALVPSQWLAALSPVTGFGEQRAQGVRYARNQALVLDALLRVHAPRVDANFAELRTRIQEARPEPRTEPTTFRGELRPYQRAGLGWLAFLRQIEMGGCLADDMGLGKTVQVLALLEAARRERLQGLVGVSTESRGADRKGAKRRKAAPPGSETTPAGSYRPSLVVAPRSLLFNWKAEAARFTPELRVFEHHGNERNREPRHFDGYDLVLTTYATMRIDIAALAAIEFDTIVLDESQAIKNASSQVSKSARLLRGRHRLALSGTPIENHLGELWSLFDFLHPGLLGSSRRFQETFSSKSVPPERRTILANALRPLILRRTKEQVAPELPARIEQTLWCELEGKQRKQYDELRDWYKRALLDTVKKKGLANSKIQVLEALLRLRQAACHPGLIDGTKEGGSAKLDLLLEQLDEILESGHRALVFSQFTSFLAIVRGVLDARRIPYCYLDGATKKREAEVQRFQSDDGPRLFLISLKAGGLGLNLTNADYVFLLDPWWNPAVEAQAIDRAHRIGRTRPVIAHRLIARDTVEEKILELQAQKRELAESIISEDNSVMRQLEVADLEMLLS